MLSYTPPKRLSAPVPAPLTPAEADAQLYTHPWEEMYARFDRHTGASAARRALAALASQDAALIAEAARDLAVFEEPLAVGVRLLCRAALGDFAGIRAQAQAWAPGDTDPLALEGLLYALVAASGAALDDGDLAAAATLISSAQLLAHVLGMRFRQQWLELERERVRLPLGTANPEAVRQALQTAPPTPARVAWAREIEAAALLGLGRWSEAADVQAGAVQMFALTLLGEAAAAQPDDSYGALALAVQALQAGQPVAPRLASVTGDPEAVYAELLLACAALRDGDLPRLPALPSAPDQRLMWSVLAWEALSRGDTALLPGRVLDALWNALRDAAAPEVLAFLAPFAPTAVMALQSSPLAVAGGPDLGLVIGEHLLWQGRTHKLPGRTGGGAAMLLADLGEPREISRMERQRVKQALRKIGLKGCPVLASAVARALAALCPPGGAQWCAALTAVTTRVDSRAAQRLLRERHAPLLEMYAEQP